ncbi:hypothetical protein JVU11DRAFT_6337 [Chiua virens]|nr:hypothetical protein JVU11DRAFT_6337 [Chiua virens]
MDVDWCLSCERKLDDFPSPSGPYCSLECLSYAQPTSSIRAFHVDSQSGAHSNRIRQWAHSIPPHIPAGAPTLPFADLPLPSPSALPSDRPPSPRARHQPTPKLIERTAASTPLPTLCVSSPAHVRPPHPSRPTSHTYRQPATTTCMSEASTSLSSLLTEPMVATPDEDASFGANIGALVRSWVNYDRANSAKCTKEEYVIEKVTDYFPPFPHGKKTSPPSSSKKSKKTPPQSPAPVSRHKQSTKKVSPPDRDRLTPSPSHTPTPVIFPSCRAAELDWAADEDEDEDEIMIASQPQYHPTYHQKYEPQQDAEPVYWTRAPSCRPRFPAPTPVCSSWPPNAGTTPEDVRVPVQSPHNVHVIPSKTHFNFFSSLQKLGRLVCTPPFLASCKRPPFFSFVSR